MSGTGSSGSGGRPAGAGPGPNPRARSFQMSAQEDVIAKKKAEIEAKLKGSSTGGEVQPADPGSSSSGSTPGRPMIGKPLPKKGFNFKNRWGFKGKKADPPVAPSAAASIPSPTKESKPEMSLSNDGNFMERFKKMQQERDRPKEVKVEPPFMPSATADPPQTKQEESWFNEALKKAREIAKKTKEGIPVSPTAGHEETVSVKTEVSPVATTSAAPAAEDPPAQQPKEEELTVPPEVAELSLPTVADELASLVAVNGDQVEEMARERNRDEEELLFLQDKTCKLYLRYRLRINELRAGLREERRRARKSRWGDEGDKAVVVAGSDGKPQVVEGRSPQLVAYAMKVFGSADLEPHQWKQCEDQMKMSLVYQDLLEMQEQQKQQAAKAQKRQYEYDSDEDIDEDEGTWEHKARRLEMTKTAREAEKLTKEARGKHHIGDFLPPDELTKFLKKYEAVKNGEVFEESDYADSKLTDSNKGFKMLQSMGWSEGSGLGANAQGRMDPVNQGNQSGDKKGLGVTKPHDVGEEDDEFDAYRKRMMLAYRFRPNPLNNPRRAYY